MRRIAILIMLAAFLAGCRVPSTQLAPWDSPAPFPPNIEHFNRGDPAKGPVITGITVDHYAKRNGWLLTPQVAASLIVHAQRATKVTFYAYDPETETPDPEKNGVLAEGVRLQMASGGVTEWGAARESPGGKTLGLYAIAENDEGRAASRVLFIAWHDGTGFRPQDIKRD